MENFVHYVYSTGDEETRKKMLGVISSYVRENKIKLIKSTTFKCDFGADPQKAKQTLENLICDMLSVAPKFHTTLGIALLAINSGYEKIAIKCLEVNPRIINFFSEKRESLLHFAAKQNMAEFCKQGLSINSKVAQIKSVWDKFYLDLFTDISKRNQCHAFETKIQNIQKYKQHKAFTK